MTDTTAFFSIFLFYFLNTQSDSTRRFVRSVQFSDIGAKQCAAKNLKLPTPISKEIGKAKPNIRWYRILLYGNEK